MYHTPYYVIHKDELDSSLRNLQNALSVHWGNYIIGYSYKTNALPWIISYFNQMGCFAEVVSEDERELSELIHVSKDHVIYNGPIKTKKSFLESLICGAYVNLDSCREIEWLDDLPAGEYNLGLRVNFDIESKCPNQSQCGSEGGRFGFCLENGEFGAALSRIKSKGFTPKGLHLHVSSKTRSIEIYREIAKIACQVAEDYRMDLSFIDIGGGFFGGLKGKPTFNDYFREVSSILKNRFSPGNVKLIVEPGMALIGSPVSYVTSVIDVKDTTFNRFVITDGSRTHIDPLMTKKNYFHQLQTIGERENRDHQIICGYTCMEHDRLMKLSNEQELKVGDKIIYEKVGAYTMCLSPLFIKYYPDVYIQEAGGLRIVRNAWHVQEYAQNSILFDSNGGR